MARSAPKNKNSYNSKFHFPRNAIETLPVYTEFNDFISLKLAWASRVNAELLHTQKHGCFNKRFLIKPGATF